MSRRMVPRPLVPPDVDVRDLDGFMLNAERLMASELFALSTGDEFKAALALWCRAWKQIPAGSLPNDDRVLAAFSGVGDKWSIVREMALRGFVLCSDGRLYHRVLCEDVVRAYRKKMERRERTKAATEARRRSHLVPDGTEHVPETENLFPDNEPLTTPLKPQKTSENDRNVDRNDHRYVVPGTGTGTGTKKKEESVSRQAAPSGGPGPLGAHEMDDHSFSLWWQSCKLTIPRDGSRSRALARWRKLPRIPVQDLTAAWGAYIDHIDQQNKTTKFRQRIRHPDSWFKDRIFEGYLDDIKKQQDERDKRTAQRAETVRHWGNHAALVIARIGIDKFDAWLLGSALIPLTQARVKLEVTKPFIAKYLTENPEIVRAIAAVTHAEVIISQPERKTA